MNKINMFNCLNRTNSISLKEKFENRFIANKKIIEKILNIEVKDMDNDNDIRSKYILKNHDKNNILKKSEANIHDNSNSVFNSENNRSMYII